MATKKISDLTLRSDFDETCNLPVDDSSQTWRVTGEQVKDFVVPFTALGDLLVGGASAGEREVLAGNTAAVEKMLTQTGTGAASALPVWREVKAPTITKLTSGSGTYSKPSSAIWLRVRMVGGGAGGVGSGTAAGTAPTVGGDSTFGSSILTAAGGGIGSYASGIGGAGGAASLGALASAGIGISGAGGGAQFGESGAARLAPGGIGGSGYFGGGGRPGQGNGAGTSGAANSGSGGGGGGISGVSSGFSGPGGGAGAYIEVTISSPSSSYPYAVGNAGNAGGAGSSGQAGGAGGTGYIEVTEYYQ